MVYDFMCVARGTAGLAMGTTGVGLEDFVLAVLGVWSGSADFRLEAIVHSSFSITVNRFCMDVQLD